MTYLIYILILQISLIVFQFRRQSLSFALSATATALLIYSFSLSDNFDHLNYIRSIENSATSLFEPLFSLAALVYVACFKDASAFLVTIFGLSFLVSFIWGDRCYLFFTTVYLGPVGVVSVRYLVAAMLMSIFLKHKSVISFSLPALVHYSSILPLTAYFLRSKWRIFLVLSIVFFGMFFKAKLFASLALTGISYERYADGSYTISLSNIFRYVLPFAGLAVFSLSQHARLSRYSVSLVFLFCGILLRFGLANIEVISRIASIFMLFGLHSAYVCGGSFAKNCVIIYLLSFVLIFGLYGWSVYPYIYEESNAIWRAYW
jgi:hypothetical protein